jgi:hypothetical protein
MQRIKLKVMFFMEVDQTLNLKRRQEGKGRQGHPKKRKAERKAGTPEKMLLKSHRCDRV